MMQNSSLTVTTIFFVTEKIFKNLKSDNSKDQRKQMLDIQTLTTTQEALGYLVI